MRAAVSFALVSVASIVAGPLLSGCTHTCTLVVCSDQVAVPELVTDRPVNALDGGRVRICRDGDCIEGVVNYKASDRLDVPDTFGCGLVDQSKRHAFTCHRVWRDGQYVDDEVNVTFVGFSSEKPPREGEVFVVELRTKDGDLVASRSGAAHYEESYPNNCGGGCQSAVLK